MKKTITIEIPEGIDEKHFKKMIKEFLEHYRNLDLVLALKNSKIDEKSLKEIEGLFEKWKQSRLILG